MPRHPLCVPDFHGHTIEDVILLGQQLQVAHNITALMARSPFVHYQVNTTKLILHHHPHDRSAGDLVKEIQRDVYGMRQFWSRDATQNRNILLDIGGHIGATAITFVKMHPAATAYTFEPAPLNFFYLAWNTVLNRVSHSVILRNQGVTSDGLPFTIEYSPDNTMSSRRASLGHSWGSLRKQQHVVRTMPLPLLIQECVAKEVTTVKLDCEGCEFSIVPNHPEFFSRSNQRIMGEYHARHVRDNFWSGHAGNVSEDAIKNTWHILCDRPSHADGGADCIEWLSCVGSHTAAGGSRDGGRYYGNPMNDRKQAAHSSILPDVRICA